MFRYPVGEAVYGRLVGKVDGWTFALFDVVTGNGLDRTLTFVVLPTKVPVVAVTARPAGAAPGDAGTTGDPEFDAAYDSAGREPGAVERLLTPAVRRQILQTRPARVIMTGKMLVHASPLPTPPPYPVPCATWSRSPR